jgi:hypothetical protein
MSASNTFEDGLLALILNNVNLANIGDATGLRGSTTAGNLYLALHTADPGETGDQTTSEISYTGYARVAVARDGTKWTVNAGAGNASLNADTNFPASTGGAGGTITHFSVGTAASGAGVRLLSGPYTPNIAVANGVTPQLKAGSTVGCD